MKNKNKYLNQAKANKSDEFYTQYKDIEKELAFYSAEQFENKTILCPCDDYEWSNFTKYFIDNFERLKLKKLICTCIAKVVKPSIFDLLNNNVNDVNTRGKLFIKTKDKEEKSYLNSDGDFRNKEIQKYKEEADIIITNPPFSLFREFFKWIIDKKFLVIGNINCITYKEIFPYIKENKIWLGTGMHRWISGFIVPPEYELYGTETKINELGQKITANNNCLWLTNLKHTKQNKPLILKTMEENIKYSKHKEIKNGYQKYDDYDAIDVPYSDIIPSDYKGVMGVPITWLGKYMS